jgi:exopolysaccharide biosynthesis polyprenyl glycosylphosphotransferase
MATAGTTLHSRTNPDLTIASSALQIRLQPSLRARIGACRVLPFLSDICSFWAVACFMIALRIGPERAYLHNPAAMAPHLWFALLYSILILLLCHAHGLYSPYGSASWIQEMVSIFKSVSFATVLIMATVFISRSIQISRLIIGSIGLLSFCTMTGSRYFRHRALRRAVADGLTCHNVIIIGTDSMAHVLREHLISDRQLGYVVLGLLSPDGPVAGPHHMGTLEDLPRLCRTQFVDEIILCGQDRHVVKSVIERAREFGVGVRVVPDLYDGLAWGAQLDYVGGFPTLTIIHREVPALELKLKRILDVVIAASCLIFLMPLLVIVALLIKLGSRGSLFYASQRVGKKGRVFSCYKFRTMVSNADAQQKHLLHLNEREGILFKMQNDPRITRVGRYLRKYSVDELPQLWNVLKCDMSLVGPRPPFASEVKQYELEYHRRLEVAPGLTGLWQVEARTSPSFEDYISRDLHYVKNWSLKLDLQILFRTVAVVISGTGS